MDIAVYIVIFVFGTLMVFTSIKGLDLRNRTSWLYGALAFLCGLIFGLLIYSLIVGLKIGALCAFSVLVGGAARRWQNQRFR